MQKNNVNISVMELSDLDEIKDILEKDFDNFWNYNIFKSELENPNSIYFIAKQSNEIIGFVGILLIIDTAEITNIVVKKSYRGNGISKILMNHIINYCQEKNIVKINLEVNSKNESAINLYQSFGFKEVGLRKKYYGNSDGVLYTKEV